MLKIGILEDETVHLERLTDALKRYGEENPGFSYSLDIYHRGYQMLKQYTPDYQLLFLDIRLPDTLGIQIAQNIREIDPDVMIVFMSSYTQYALEGYSVNAFDYIVKPLLYPAFAVKMDRILRVLGHQEQSRRYIMIKSREGSMPVCANEITYIEVSGHDLLVHTEKKTIEAWGTLKKLEDELNSPGFSRCNACYLINLKYVVSVRGFCVTVNQDELMISKGRKKEFMDALAQFRGGSR